MICIISYSDGEARLINKDYQKKQPSLYREHIWENLQTQTQRKPHLEFLF